MKTNILTAVIILTGCLCVWGYLSAQSDGTQATPPVPPAAQSALLEIREPSQEDFEHCAKRAVDFFESWSEDQAKMDIVVQELYSSNELPTHLMIVPRQLAQIKAGIKYGHPELIAKKTFGENVVLLYYVLHTDQGHIQGDIFSRFQFTRTLDSDGNPEQWRCWQFILIDPEMVFSQL